MEIMIEINFQYGFLIYFFICFIPLIIIWGISFWKQIKDNWSSEKQLFLCRNCGHYFLSKKEVKDNCPKCNDLCILKRKKGISKFINNV